MTNKEIIEVIQAFEDGKSIEAHWKIEDITRASNWYEVKSGIWDFENHIYRIKPKPKCRTMWSDEFPSVWWFRNYAAETWNLVLCQSSFNFRYHGIQDNEGTVEKIFDEADIYWQWSPNRKDIKSFFIEDV